VCWLLRPRGDGDLPGVVAWPAEAAGSCWLHGRPAPRPAAPDAPPAATRNERTYVRTYGLEICTYHGQIQKAQPESRLSPHRAKAKAAQPHAGLSKISF
jgi:hypothetical protein